MLDRVTIKSRLIFLLVFSAVLLIGSGVQGLRGLQESNETLTTSYENWIVPIKRLKIISDTYSVRIVDASHKVQNGTLSTGEGLGELDAAAETISAEWREFSASQMTPQEIELIAQLRPMMRRADESLNELRGAMRNGDLAGVKTFTATRLYPGIDPVVSKLTQLVDAEIAVVKDEIDRASERYRVQRFSILLLVVAGIGLSTVVGLSVIRSITSSLYRVTRELQELSAGDADLTQRIPAESRDEVGDLSRNFNHLMDNLLGLVRRIHGSGIQVTSSSTQIAASSRQLEATVSEQVASTNEVVATSKEISATSQELVRTMTEVAAMSEQAAASAGSGQEGLGRMGEAMRQMEEASRSISSRLSVISEKANNINSVVATINKVADQTNLLSLNAAIEAEKAGEYGLGFSVVAREIRRLADQTAVATLDIEQMVKEMRSAVSAGVMEMDRFSEEVRRSVGEVGRIGSQLGQIIEQVQALTPRFESVNEGMQAQAQGAQQISEAMVQLSEAARQTAESLRDTNGAIGQLNDAARGLQQEVSRFKVAS